MIRTLDFNAFAAGTVIDDEYEGVTISAIGGSGEAMIFDSANPTGDDTDLASDTLGGLLIISTDGDSTDPDDHDGGGTISFDFDNAVRMKTITLKDIEETTGEGTRLVFYDANGAVIANHFVQPTADGGETTIQLNVPDTARFEVVFEGSGAIDNVIFDDSGFTGGGDADGIVSNDDEDALIDTSYTGDPDGDMIDNADALLPGEAAEDDIVDAQGGNDTIHSGEGDDDVYAGAGDDVVEGGAGDDVIYGDRTLDGGAGAADDRESFEWDLAGIADGGDLSSGFTQDTGNVSVTFSASGGTNATSRFSTDTGKVSGIPTDGSPADANSSLVSEAQGNGNSIEYTLDFSDSVSNADFRINDVNAGSVVRVQAFDADGNPIEVNLTGGSALTLSDTDGVTGNDTAQGDGGNFNPDNPDYSILVNIPGPVSRIEIEHSQVTSGNSGVYVTDVYFDAPAVAPVAGGDDDLDGQDGDDLIYGEGGDDTLTGGAGADTLSGGDGADLFQQGTIGDVVDGGAGGDDNDTLDLRESGPLRIVDQTDDADGNSTSGTVEFLNADGSVSGTMSFAEIENLLLPEDDNNAPDAVDDSDTTEEETAITVDLLANDTDPDGDDLTVTEATVPAAQGMLVNNGDGTVTFTPADGFTGEATISYTIEDEGGLSDSAVHTITVTDAGNSAPVAVDDSSDGVEDTETIVNLLANDSDPDLDALTVVDASVPAEQGSVSDNGDGTWTFTPAPDFNGEATITYTIEDPSGAQDTATHTVNVAPVNDAPDAVDDVDVTAEDTAVTVDLLANDTDVDGDELTVVEATVPAEQGTLVNNGDGTVTFTPAPDFTGEVTISYTIEDPAGEQDSAEHTVYVNEVSDGPVAEDDEAATDEDTPVTIDVLANDSDPDGDDLIISDASVPEEQGTVEIVDGELVFTPAPDFNGEATISYVAEDPDGNESAAQVTVTVAPVNDAPVAEDDSDITDEGTPITVDLLANDSDLDGDDLSVVDATVPADQGTLVDNGDGTVTFTPAGGFTGEATISYTIEDEEGLQDSAEHAVFVNVADDAPVAVDDTATTEEDTPVTIDVLANDTDPNGDPLTIISAEVPEEQGMVEIVDGELVFTPAPDFNGDATITYMASDPDGNVAEGSASVAVTPVNDAPVAEDDADTTDFNTPVTVDLLANDSDVDGDDLSVVDATVPADQGTLVDNGDGTVTFTPVDGFEGVATISYTIEDEDGLQDSAVHTITVGDNDAPVAVDDEATTDEDTPVTIDLTGNDTDANGDPLTLKDANVPAEQGTLVDNGDGTVTFTPAPDFNGEATITYTVCDPSGAEDEGTATVTVTPVNDAPVAEDDSDVTDINTPVTVDLLANDSDVDGDDLSVVEATVPAAQGTLVDNGDGTVTFSPAGGFTGDATISYTIEDEEGLQDSAVHTINVSDPAEAPTAEDDTGETDEDTPVTIDVLANDTDPQDDPLTLTDASVPPEQGTVEIVDNMLVFTPAPDFTGLADVTYTVEDPDGNADEGTATINVAPVNDAPVAEDDVATTEEDTPVVIDLVDNDSDPDGDPLTVFDVSVPPEQGTVVDNGDGTATFTPAPDFVGEATVTYTVEDPSGASDTAEHVVTVTPINDAPEAVGDTAETPEDTPVTIDLTGNDTDADGDPLTLKDASVPAEQGTLVDNGDGTVTFTPAPDFNGEATITYTVCDPNGGEDTGTAVVTVTPVNDAPVAVDDVDTTAFNTPEIVDLLGNDTDPDGDPLTLVSATVPAEQGTLEDNGDGTVTFTPADGFEGEATITYVVSDPDGLTDEGVAVVTVTEDPRDGIVEGTDGDDLIDVDYDGDPDGDFVDNEDALLPGTSGDDDSIVAGDGNDTVLAGEGSDTVDGGTGDDVINTGNGGLAPDLGYPFSGVDGIGYDPDTDPEDDRDSVDGGEGNDTITTGDDRDTINGGIGDDVIDSGIDDDIVNGDEGDDRIVGGEGNDLIEGGDGNDTIYAGNDPDLGLDIFDLTDEDTGGLSPDRNPNNGQDTVFGGAGDDVIFGADDDDVLDGGTGNDLLDGQIDDDTLTGGEGDDTLLGGQGDDSLDGGEGNDSIDGGTGDDTLAGGDDRDTFVNVNAGDEVDGGDGGDDFDTLDLRGSLPPGGSYIIDFTSEDREDGTINYFDEDGNDAGSLVFQEIESIIPCFTPGTKIATPKGEINVEDLQVGDRVITRDNGIQELRWVGARDMSGEALEHLSHLKPVLIRQGALGNDLPERDMMVSPNHRILVANDKTALYFEEREVLVAAKHLTAMEGIDIVEVSQTTYIHVMFDQHEVILSDGTWTESFQPGDQSLAGIGDEQREEILELFPELATEKGVENYASARRSLKKHEAKLVLK